MKVSYIPYVPRLCALVCIRLCVPLMKYQASQVHMYAANSRVLADVTDLGVQPSSYEREPPAPAVTAARMRPMRDSFVWIALAERIISVTSITMCARFICLASLTNVHCWRNAYYYYEEVSVSVGADEGAAIDVIQEFLVRSSGRTDDLNFSPPEYAAARGQGLSALAP